MHAYFNVAAFEHGTDETVDELDNEASDEIDEESSNEMFSRGDGEVDEFGDELVEFTDFSVEDGEHKKRRLRVVQKIMESSTNYGIRSIQKKVFTFWL